MRSRIIVLGLLKSLTFLLGRITVAVLYSDVKYFTNDHVLYVIYMCVLYACVCDYNLQLNECLCNISI